VTSIGGRPPRRWARATLPLIEARFTSPTTTAGMLWPPKRTGSASSQKSSGPGLSTVSFSTPEVSDDRCPTSGERSVKTSKASVVM
jgi:hypothetical protein